MDGPEDKKRTIADIISHISWFTNRIKWILNRDLKPRVLFGTKTDGTIVNICDAYGFPKINPLGKRPKKGSETGTGVVAASLTVPAGKVWEVLITQASFLCDSTVADRTCRILHPELGLGGVAATSPTSLLVTTSITLSKDEYGYMIILGTVGNTILCDNGVTSAPASQGYSPPLWLGPGADISAKIVANGTAGDLSGIDILYFEHDLES